MSWDETQDLFDRPTDPLIDEQVAESQDYNFVTTEYGKQVAIDNRVDSGTQSILNLLDNRATQFLNCQFMEGAELGFESVMLEDGTIVPPLSELTFDIDANGILNVKAKAQAFAAVWNSPIKILLLSLRAASSGVESLPHGSTSSVTDMA